MISDLVPWLCWVFPTLGTVLALLLAKVNRRVRDVSVVFFSFLGWLMSVLMIPDLFAARFVDKPLFWITLPTGKWLGLGMLVDPLSIILANVVAFISFVIMVYSIKYMEEEPGQTRYWFLMSLFIGSMLLLILADNLILFFVGWKIVGLCSYALIGHYYSDEREYWIGGPPPHPFQKPSS
ncbi:NADH-quinone oxidoreductase subunit L, partial [Candidatus Bathyarchaeota archaeon]